MSIEILHTFTDRTRKGERSPATQGTRVARFDHVLDFPLILKSENGIERKCEAPLTQHGAAR
jgi:hypothetical protein